MGSLVVSCEMTLDGVIDRIDEWFIQQGDHEDYSLEKLRQADALLLGRKTYLLAYELATNGLVDEFRVWIHPTVLGGRERVFHGRRVSLELLEMKTFHSGVVLLRYGSA